jgi:hypothetical protein
MAEEIAKKYGALAVIGYRDARTAKVAIVRCDCGKVVEAPTEALAAGEILNCGRCRPAPATPAADSFAGAVASEESWGAKKRHFGGGGAR